MGIFAGLGADAYDRDYSDRYLVGRLFSYLRPYRGQVWLVVLITILFGAMGAIIPVTIAWGVDVLGEADPAAGLPLVLIALASIAVIDYALYRQRRLLTARLIATLISQLRKDAFNAALERDMVFYDDNKSGKIVSRITSDTQELNQLSLVVTDLVSQFLEFALILIILFTREWRLTLMTMAMIPTVILLTVVFRYFARIVTRQGSRMMAVVNDNIQETVTGISVAKNFRQEAMIYDTFADVNAQSYDVNLRRGLVLATVFPVLNMMIGFFIAAVTYFGAMAVYDGVINIGAWYLFVQSSIASSSRSSICPRSGARCSRA